MFKFVVLSALVAVAFARPGVLHGGLGLGHGIAVAPVAVASGVSHTSRTDIIHPAVATVHAVAPVAVAAPVAVVGHGVGLGHGLGLGLGGHGLGLGLGLGHGIGLGHGVGLGHGIGLGHGW